MSRFTYFRLYYYFITNTFLFRNFDPSSLQKIFHKSFHKNSLRLFAASSANWSIHWCWLSWIFGQKKSTFDFHFATYIDEWRDGWWLERQIFALSSGNGLQHYRRILLIQPVSLRSRLRLKFIDIPYPTSMERLEWRRALVPFGYQSQATDVLKSLLYQKKITSTAAVSFYRKTPKNLHIRYSRIQMCIGYCTLVAIWQCYSLMNWETQQSRDLCWEMPDWVNRPKIQICCFYLF